MSLVLSLHTGTIYKEVYLPILTDQDYKLFLPSGEYGLKRDMELSMETMGGEWRFLPSDDYSVFENDRPFENRPLRGGQFLHVKLPESENIAILVWQAAATLSAFRKYRIIAGQITIGLESDNAICYQAHNLISRHHAMIVYRDATAYLCDRSKNGTYLGGRILSGEVQLHFGDTINLYGLKILFLGTILAINALGGEAVIDSGCLQEITETPQSAIAPDPPEDYREETTIHISPRNIPKIYTEPEVIENVPAKNEGDGRPALMSILPSMTMVLPMIVGFLLMNGGLGFGIVIAVGSAVVGTTWAIINYSYAVKDRKKKEKLRLVRYEEYLVQCSDSIREKYENNRSAVLSLYPDAETCSTFSAASSMLWDRKQRHNDFLSLRVGLGELPFQVTITAPRQGFSLKDDELAERPQKIAESYLTLREVPVCADLLHQRVVGILAGGDQRKAIEMARMLVVQIAANHCYTDVKMAFLYRGGLDTAQLWEFVRWLPHVWNEEQSQRYVADRDVDIDDVLYTLAQILRGRAEQSSDSSFNKSPFLPHFVIFVEDPKLLETQMIARYLFEESADLGVTTVILADSYEGLPSACSLVIEQSEEFCGVYGTEKETEARRKVHFDRIELEAAEAMARRMCSMRVHEMKSGSNIPASLSFFDMYGVQRLDELEVVEHWRKNRTYETMRAAIGQKAGGQICYLDINEKHHGPHGLVAGTTGSGKSETLQTYILSLALNFSPQDVGFFIIDFKGGGMANLFAELPHMIGQISNLSGNQVRRAMVSIKSENMRRQRIFGEFGVNHIDAYTKLVKNKEAAVAIPHMLIIIDEFAELKREQPEFMKELISVAQVGRSLGVHLILSTQKPSGTVDENIWSNTKFKLCLRVADKQDSVDMLHKPDAAFLTQVGRGYLQVGNDEVYELFQSGWSGAQYIESGESDSTSAVLLDLQGREPIAQNRSKTERKRKQTLSWISFLVSTILQARDQLGMQEHPAGLEPEKRAALARKTIELLNRDEKVFQEKATDVRRMEEIIEMLPEDCGDLEGVAEYLIDRYQRLGKKLPERQEKTQLAAVVHYLAEIAKKTGMVNEQQLWMPLLPESIALTQLPGFSDISYRNGGWIDHREDFRLNAYIGMVDDPEHQQQFPLAIDLADKGHLAVVGGVSSGKSTFLQSYIFSLIRTYSPAELNCYIVDYSSQSLCAFEGDAHVGGVVIEGEDDKLNKLFVMLADMLQQRKKLIRGGSFRQFVKLNQEPIPAVVVVIDGYASFNEKTEGRFESQLLEFSRTAEGYGIYLIISCGGFGSGELQSKIAGNFRQSICLELGDKYLYGDVLHTMHFDVLPEENVRGRGLALIDGSVLEYQTALACDEKNDYARGEWIRQTCKEMSEAWTGLRAAPIPMIPEKPQWEEFRLLPGYTEQIRTGAKLPAAYFQETAAIYSVDLATTYCYLILGSDRSGKSVYLKNLMCAASEIGGQQYLIDLGNTDGADAALTQAQHITSPEELAEMLRDLILQTNERGAVRKKLREQGLDDEEIFQQISADFPPLFIFVADLKLMLDSIYKNVEGIGKLSPWFENIVEKGQLLNVFFFAAANTSAVPLMSDKAMYLSFIKSRRGVLLGGELNKQSVFQYQNIRYADQGKRLKVGMGYATGMLDGQDVDLIVIPNNRRRKPEA